MTGFTDEEVMAYADDELPPRRRLKLLEALSHDPVLARRLEQYSLTRRRIAEPFDRLVLDPPPPHLLAAILGRDFAASQTQRVKPFMYSRTVLKRLAEKYSVPAWSIAAVPALALALLLGLALAGNWASLPEPSVFTLNESGLVAAAPLRDALDTGASGKDHALAGHQAVTLWPTGTYSTDQGWCRAYLLIYDGGKARAPGLACRTASREWRIDQQKPINRLTGPAAGPGTVAGQLLSPAEEAELIRKKWARER